jgi:hypothetical protein
MLFKILTIGFILCLLDREYDLISLVKTSSFFQSFIFLAIGTLISIFSGFIFTFVFALCFQVFPDSPLEGELFLAVLCLSCSLLYLTILTTTWLISSKV